MQQWRRCLATICVVGALLGLTESAAAIDVVVTGNWSETIDAADLVGGAGTNLTSSHESPSDQVSLRVSNTAGVGDAWSIDVHRVDGVSWSGSIALYARRTGDGGGSVTGGITYQSITTTAQSFFSGSDDVSEIAIQLKLDGMSIQIAPDTYAAMVIFTVVDM